MTQHNRRATDQASDQQEIEKLIAAENERFARPVVPVNVAALCD